MSTQLSAQAGRGANRHRSLTDRLVAVEPQLWAAMLVTLIADVALTHYGLQVGLAEGNPLMRAAIETAGIAALFGIKLSIVIFGVGVRLTLGERGVVVPVGLAVPWLLAAVINAVLLGLALPQ
ncbi:putative membrane protein [Halapricum desulfuricans]|uniref:Putative membrane protein n=1 Tax=Halapricum desulfuricans TaxID=2841257 RepID=A0A897NPF2_9EURY|nr:DUF5658 family protein [Halapricum desulfuricans]QSG12753.1 putative membrane protein [Halapricum desulfuricans]